MDVLTFSKNETVKLKRRTQQFLASLREKCGSKLFFWIFLTSAQTSQLLLLIGKLYSLKIRSIHSSQSLETVQS